MKADILYSWTPGICPSRESDIDTGIEFKYVSGDFLRWVMVSEIAGLPSQFTRLK